MKGLQYIYPNRSFTLKELEHFMREHWDKFVDRKSVV